VAIAKAWVFWVLLMISVQKKIELWIGFNERRVIESSASNECVGGHVFWW
jgi:hypothetical protein